MSNVEQTSTKRFDFAVLDNAEEPKSVVYEVETERVVATFPSTSNGQWRAEYLADSMNRVPIF